MQAAFMTRATDDDCNKSSSFLMSSQPCKHIRTVGPSPCPELYTKLLEPQEQSCSGSQPTVESLEMSELTSLHRREPEKGNNSVSNRREVSSGPLPVRRTHENDYHQKTGSCPDEAEHRSHQTERSNVSEAEAGALSNLPMWSRRPNHGACTPEMSHGVWPTDAQRTTEF